MKPMTSHFAWPQLASMILIVVCSITTGACGSLTDKVLHEVPLRDGSLLRVVQSPNGPSWPSYAYTLEVRHRNAQ